MVLEGCREKEERGDMKQLFEREGKGNIPGKHRGLVGRTE